MKREMYKRFSKKFHSLGKCQQFLPALCLIIVLKQNADWSFTIFILKIAHLSVGLKFLDFYFLPNTSNIDNSFVLMRIERVENIMNFLIMT